MKRELQIATLPVVALRGLVIFPKMMLHFDIGRKKSAAALNAAMEGEREMLLKKIYKRTIQSSLTYMPVALLPLCGRCFACPAQIISALLWKAVTARG